MASEAPEPYSEKICWHDLTWKVVYEVSRNDKWISCMEMQPMMKVYLSWDQRSNVLEILVNCKILSFYRKNIDQGEHNHNELGDENANVLVWETSLTSYCSYLKMKGLKTDGIWRPLSC